MKILITILCIASISASASSLFDSIKTIEGYETNYSLSSIKHNHSINLECQSFFNKFDIYKDNKLVSERYITRKECEVLETKAIVCLKEKSQVCFNDENIFEAKCSCN